MGEETWRGGLWTLMIVGALTLITRADEDDGEKTIEFSDAAIRIEINDTDGDAGIQMFVDGEPWKTLKVVCPDGKRVLEVKAKGSVRQQGLTELFFESAEPSFEDQTLEELKDLFRRAPTGSRGARPTGPGSSAKPS